MAGWHWRGLALVFLQQVVHILKTFDGVCLHLWWSSYCLSMPLLVGPFGPKIIIGYCVAHLCLPYLSYLFKHPFRIWNSWCLFPSSIDCGQVLSPCCQLVHGYHGIRRLLTTQFQHWKQVQWSRTHIGQTSNLGKIKICKVHEHSKFFDHQPLWQSSSVFQNWLDFLLCYHWPNG